MAAGYSQTPMLRKLGYKPGFRVFWGNVPPEYPEWLGDLPDGCDCFRELGGQFHLLHFFTDSHRGLVELLPALRAAMYQDGMLWISWPKKASKVPSDLTEDIIRAEALAANLVDVKVCAVSEVWSGLKLVIRKKDRIG